MSIRFFLLWVVISAIVGAYLYVTKTKRSKKEVRAIAWKAIICGAVGATFLGFLIYGINNIQGV